jgi:hypothetical protein
MFLPWVTGISKLPGVSFSVIILVIRVEVLTAARLAHLTARGHLVEQLLGIVGRHSGCGRDVIWPHRLVGVG